MRQSSRYPGPVAGLVLTGVFTLVLGLGCGVVASAAAWKNRCSLYGPAPSEALISEHSVVHEERSWWPIGTTCDYLRADGRGTVRGTTGFPELTAATYGPLLTGVGALTAAAVLTRRRDGIWRPVSGR